MDRNAVDKINVSYDEIIAGLASQIGQLNYELMVNKIMLQKAQELLHQLDHKHDHKTDEENSF